MPELRDDAAGGHFDRLGVEQPAAADRGVQRDRPNEDVGHARAAQHAVEVFRHGWVNTSFIAASTIRATCRGRAIEISIQPRSRAGHSWHVEVFIGVKNNNVAREE